MLLHPKPSHAVVNSSNLVAAAVVEFHERLGIDRDRQALDAKRWRDAVAEAQEKLVLEQMEVLAAEYAAVG